ncbi:MAG: hypothetical protein EA417_05660 [Gammaproteobacteria bacterium]|nr:MAG: hypothetical protein EA417_05660 [Gammaproteobacteria bacterium]
MLLAGCMLAVGTACGDGRSLDPEADDALDEALEAQQSEARDYAERVEDDLADRDYDAVAERIEEEREQHQAELEAEMAEREAEMAERAAEDPDDDMP